MEDDSKTDTPAPVLGYARFGADTFTRVSGFVPRLDPGAYRVQATFSGIMYVRIDVSLDELISFDDSPARGIMEEVRRFWELKERYRHYGIVHKRGFLLYGPPGTGKTSVLHILSDALAREHDGVTLFLATGADPSLITSAISEIRAAEPERALLVVMEDVELVYRHHQSEFLELLDGGSNAEDVAFVGTTNHIENLPPRVRDRPSRFDIVMEIGGPSEAVRAEYLRRKLVPDEAARAIAAASDGLSFAHLKEFVVGHLILGKSIEEVARQLRDQAGIGLDDDDEEKAEFVHDEDDEPETADDYFDDDYFDGGYPVAPPSVED